MLLEKQETHKNVWSILRITATNAFTGIVSQFKFRLLKSIVRLTKLDMITKLNRKIAADLCYNGIEFPVTEKDYDKVKVTNNICINVLGCQNGLAYPLCLSSEKFEDQIDLLLMVDASNKRYIYITDFNRLMYNKTKHKEKKIVDIVFNVLVEWNEMLMKGKDLFRY